MLSGLAITPSTFRAGPTPRVVHSRTRVGTTIRFTLSEAATVTLSFAESQPGRLVSGQCRQPTASNRAEPRCTRYSTVATITVPGRAGANAVPFSGMLSRTKRLAPAVYRMTATPTDSAHRTGRPRAVSLTVAAR